MTTAKTPNPQSHFRLPDPPPREPDEMTAFDHVYKHGNNRYLAIHLDNQDTTLVVADRWIIAHPDADRSRARRPDLAHRLQRGPRGLPRLQRLHRLRTGQAARLRPRSRLREHRSHRHRRQAPGLRRPMHLRILALRRNRTAPRRSPRRRPGLSATDTDLSPSSNCPTAPCRATALRSNLFLHWQDGQLLWIDPATQRPILTYEDQLSRAQQAAARISELENEVRRLRGQ